MSDEFISSCQLWPTLGYYWRGGYVGVWVMLSGWGLWAGQGEWGGEQEGVWDEGVPHENQRNSLATGDRINIKWGAPIHLAPSSNTEPNDSLRKRGGGKGWGVGTCAKIWMSVKLLGVWSAGRLPALHLLKLVSKDINRKAESVPECITMLIARTWEKNVLREKHVGAMCVFMFSF